MIIAAWFGLIFITFIIFSFTTSILYLKFKKDLKIYDLSENLVMIDKNGENTEAFVKIGEHDEESIDLNTMKFNTSNNMILHFHA
jgi:hypothetical protein